jgi:hypothetical protein
LLLSGRQRFRVLFFFVQQTDLVERSANAATRIPVTDTGNNQRQGDVIENRSII